jgi:predicted signal transduction protein with EAL and GGDEF domain
MALFDLVSSKLDRPRRAGGRKTPAADLEAVLIREQYRALAQMAPYFYGAAIAAAATVSIAAQGLWSPLFTVALPVAFLPFAVRRAAYWLKIRERVDSLSLEAIQRDIRRASVAGPALAFAFSVIAAAVPQIDGLERALVLYGVWIPSAATAFCLTRLAYAAGLIVFGASAPLVAAFLCSGGTASWLAAPQSWRATRPRPDPQPYAAPLLFYAWLGDHIRRLARKAGKNASKS